MAHRTKTSTGTQRRGGFTLLELIVVITIIGILSSIVVMSTRGAGPKARKTKAMADMRSIHSVAVALYNESGRWPESVEEMVNAKSEDGLPAIASLEKFPTDPWGNEYVYEVVDGQAVVRCLGNDGAEGGEGEAADMQIPEQEDTW